MENKFDIKSSLSGIQTEDGYTPLYQPDAKFEWWNMKDVYFGKIGKNKVIPKVDDYVIVPELGEIYIVRYLDPVTFIPSLSPITLKAQTINDSITSATEQNYRIYYDRSQKPYTLTPDAFLYSYSSEATVARIYKGLIIDDNEIISQVFNNSGTFIGFDIKLEVVAFDSHDNYSIKHVPSCNTDVELKDGEACTIVLFDSRGKVVSKAHCIIDETTYVIEAYAKQKYITNIYMKSFFLDKIDSTTINFPVNLTTDSLMPTGVVVYNDGTEVEYLVDGTKFSLYGLDVVDDNLTDKSIINSFASTTVGHKFPLVLCYNKNPNEQIGAVTGHNPNNGISNSLDPNKITKKYELVVSEPNRAYGVKLYVYPEWIDEVSGYQLKFYMLNLERDMFYHIPQSLVSLSEDSRPYSSKLYGVTQRLTYIIDLSQVSSSYNKFNYVQTFEMILRAPANKDEITNIWEVATEFPTNLPFFGTDLRARIFNVQKNSLSIKDNFKNVDDMLDKLYNNTSPLVNRTIETSPLKPTHMSINYNGEEKLIKVSEYAKELVFKNKLELYKNVEIIFYRESIGTFLTLSVANLTIRK